MARPPTQRVLNARKSLLQRLADGFHRPGDRFLSNRAVAQQFKLSYQTADRLLREMVQQGLLQRRAASGTYIPGQRLQSQGVQLVFHRRARRKSSFGARLLRELTKRLDHERIDWRIHWAQPPRPPALSDQWYPVIWESPQAIAAAARTNRPALLLNDRPPAGLDSILLDSVSVDDFSGGVCAAQLLAQTSTHGRRAVVSGPSHDPRSQARVRGFLSTSRATVIASPNWYVEGGLAVAHRALAAGPGGIFCCNDRLAEAIIRHCREEKIVPPPLVGFDDAPIAQWLDLTTIAIPWNELVTAAIGVIKRRGWGDTSAAIAQIVATRPILRQSTLASIPK